jgi:nicotinamidase-related amidase
MTDAPLTLDPQQTALLVMDFQPAILGRLDDSEALLSAAAEAIDIVRDEGGHVGYVRVAFDDSDYEAMPPTNKTFAPIAAGRLMHHEAPETAVHERVAPQPGDIVVRKTRVGAFSTTDLDQQLRERGITTLILAGISTSGVVLSTVRDAADRDYELFVLSDASGDPDADVHAMLTEKVFPRQGHVITTDELPGLFGGSGAQGPG